MARESNNFFVPRTSLRSPGFFGPVTLTTVIILISAFTAPFDEDFSVVRINDPTFIGTIGIWGTCSRYRAYNATTANPEATLTGNATFDAMVHKQGKHHGCSSATIGWSFSLPVNSTGLAGIPLPDSDSFGVNNPSDGNGVTWVQVMTKSQSIFLLIHLIAGVLVAQGMLLLLIPYKLFENSMPGLSRFFKSGSASLVLILLGTLLAFISFFLTLFTAIKVRDRINAIGNGGGVKASIGNLMWFSLITAIINIPPIWSTRGRMGDK